MADRPTPADVLAKLKPAAQQVKQTTRDAAQAHYQQAPAAPAQHAPLA